MRNLGKGQSVVFCVPKEIRSNIQALRGENDKSPINVSDVLLWAVSETWSDTRRNIPLWAVQGTRFERQRELWQACREGESLHMTSMQAEKFLEPECQTLEQRYRPDHQERSAFYTASDHNHNLNLIWERCQMFEGLDAASSILQEEQERELAPEIESERQVQRPPVATPESHQIHPHVSLFVATGVLTRPSEAYQPAYHTLRNTSAASFLDVSQFPSSLLATNDFCTTVTIPLGSSFVADAFQRPVRWILMGKESVACDLMHMIIISPYEANFLMPEIRKSKFVTLHPYAPRQSRGFPSLDKFTLYTVPGDVHRGKIPDILRIQLMLFSGQLYLESYSEYQNLCAFLGVASVKTPAGLIVAADGFIKQSTQGRRDGFSQSPLKFLEVLMSRIRKDCQAIGRTHIGKIVDGQLLFPADFHESATASIETSLQTLDI